MCFPTGAKGAAPPPRRRPRRAIGLAAAAALAVATPALRAEDKFDTLKFKYEVAREAAMKPVSTLRQQYLDRLGELEGKFSTAGDFHKVVAIREAIAAGAPDPGAPAEQPVELAAAQKLYFGQLRARTKESQARLLDLLKRYGRELVVLRGELTRAGELEQAGAVDGEIDKIAAELREVEHLREIGGDRKLTGRFHVQVDDTAEIFVNGKRVHHQRATGQSPTTKLGVGDCVVFRLRNHAGTPKHFITAFQSDDKAYTVSFRTEDMRIVPDGTEQRVFTRAEFAKFTGPAVKRAQRVPVKIPFAHSSEWMWEHGNNATLATFITPEMVRPTAD